MKPKNNAGFSLIDVLVAIVLLGILVVPTCTSLLFSVRMNERAEEMLQAQLAVSSTVETLMAEGIDPGKTYTFPDVDVDVLGKEETGEETFYKVTVTSTEIASVSVTTFIRHDISVPYATTPPAGGGTS